MSGFKFNFLSSETDVNDSVVEKSLGECEKVDASEARQFDVKDEHRKNIEAYRENANSFELRDGTTLSHVTHTWAESQVKQRLHESTEACNITMAIEAKSDLDPQKYEGGLKIWECSEDLVNYLATWQIAFRGIKVLELGCGAGLPGLFALKQGASVHFQDFNAEVLNLVTIPNVLLNMGNPDAAQCYFVSGDWTSVQNMLQGNTKFDVILTSETIYDPKSYKKLHNILQALLAESGYVLLAAKSCYFGVGGSVSEFVDFVKTQGVFDAVTCQTFTEGVERQILKLTFIKSEET